MGCVACLVAIFTLCRRGQGYHWDVGEVKDVGCSSGRLIAELCILLVPALTILILASSQTGFNHHYRYLLGAYPVTCVSIASMVYVSSQLQWKWCERLFCVCLAVQVWMVVLAFPNYISYFNISAGGPRGARYFLSDSSIDWGQDLLRLRDWQHRHPQAEPMFVFTFTGVKPSHLGVRSTRLSLRAAEPGTVHVIPETGFLPGWYAVSDCVYQGREIWIYDDFSAARIVAPGEFEMFRTLTPIDRVGGSIDIFFIHPSISR